MSATELARLEGLQPQSLTRIIAELETAGFIKRRKSQADGRQLDIEISEKGTELLTLDARRQNAWLAKAMETQMTAAERAVLAVAADILDRIGSAKAFSDEVGPNFDRPRRKHAA